MQVCFLIMRFLTLNLSDYQCFKNIVKLNSALIVTLNLSMFQVSHLRKKYILYVFLKVVELVGEVSVINWAYPVKFCIQQNTLPYPTKAV